MLESDDGVVERSQVPLGEDIRKHGPVRVVTTE